MGKDIFERDSALAVTTTAQQLVKSSPKRKYLIFSNMSASDVYLRPNKAPTSTLNILLEASGGFVEISEMENKGLVGTEWWLLGAANVTILLIEGIEQEA